MDEMKRLFIAVPVKGPLLEAALAWQANHVGWPVNWLEGEAFHITVVSPWVEADVPVLVNKLDEFTASVLSGQISIKSFAISFFKVVFGPNRFAPRLIWAEGEPPVPLLELKNRLEQALAKPDNRFYRLHLTLARFLAADFGPAGLPDLFDRVEWKSDVDSFVLFESIMKPEGPEYIKIKEFTFSNGSQNQAL
ncbi:MAG: 2'-5' RNA ligase family protein [Candidatus Paceibacterota bacterium]